MGIHLNLTIDLTFHQNSIPESTEFLAMSIKEAERNRAEDTNYYAGVSRSLKKFSHIKFHKFKLPGISNILFTKLAKG